MAANDKQSREQHARQSEKSARPAQVPGDAESPPKGSKSPAAQKAAEHTDRTEPVRSAQDQPR